MTITRVMIVALLALVACGDDDNNPDIDAAVNPPGDDGGVDAAIDAPGSTADASVGVTCGAATCIGTQECCTGGAGGNECVDEGTCQTVTFACDGPEDCPGQVCCVGGGGGPNGPEGSECKNANQCPNNLCHEATDCGGNTPECCDIGTTGFKACLAQCPP